MLKSLSGSSRTATGMDQKSKDLLMMDLFVQAPHMKWQEKVLLPAQMFTDALYQKSRSTSWQSFIRKFIQLNPKPGSTPNGLPLPRQAHLHLANWKELTIRKQH